MKHLVLVDMNLRVAEGHYLQYAKSVAAAAMSLGCKVSWVTARQFDRRLAPVEVEVDTLFEYHVFHEFQSEGENWTLENFNVYNHYIFSELFTRMKFRNDEAVFLFPNLIQNQLYAVIEWSKELRSGSFVVAILRWQNADMDYNVIRGASSAVKELYCFCFNRINSESGRVFIATDTKRLAGYFQGLSSVAISQLPNPQVSVHSTNINLKSRLSMPFVVGFFGGFQRLRGSHLMADIVKIVLTENRQIRFVIHIIDLGSVDALEMVEVQKLYKENIVILGGVLSTSIYNFALANSSVVLMPYSPRFYHWGSSGIACEALSFGVPAVVTAGTTMHQEYEEFEAGCIAVERYDAHSFSLGIFRALDAVEHLTAASVSAAKNYRERTSPERFVRELLSLRSSEAEASLDSPSQSCSQPV